ncbi:MAG TPA: AAA family ATPase [Patescibacteria group bacterium]|nr:AAA family ATPase [Patescibacteria group bacterium]
MSQPNKKVLILTGPGGAGKTTIANLLAEKSGFVWVDGDHLDSEFFPDGYHWRPENSEKLKQAHQKIFNEVKKSFNNGENSVVLDYIIFGHYLEFLEMFKKEFGDKLEIKVLFPSQEEMIKRDEERECWTTGVERIAAVRAEFEGIKDTIGEENYLDTTRETPLETFSRYFEHLVYEHRDR